MRILIIEDEYPGFVRLKRMLQELSDIDNSIITVDGPLGSIKEIISYFSDNDTPDLIISDIRLTDGLVFDAFDHIGCRTRIIFTTAYSDYTIKAFDYNSIHYLLKPIETCELKAALEKCKLYPPEDLSGTRALTIHPQKDMPRKRFLVQRPDGMELVNTDDVAYIHYDSGSLTLVGFDGKCYPCGLSTDECDQQLDGDVFFRVNRQYIININAVDKVINCWDRKMKIILKNFQNVEICISRSRSNDLKKWLDR